MASSTLLAAGFSQTSHREPRIQNPGSAMQVLNMFFGPDEPGIWAVYGAGASSALALVCAGETPYSSPTLLGLLISFVSRVTVLVALAISIPNAVALVHFKQYVFRVLDEDISTNDSLVNIPDAGVEAARMCKHWAATNGSEPQKAAPVRKEIHVWDPSVRGLYAASTFSPLHVLLLSSAKTGSEYLAIALFTILLVAIVASFVHNSTVQQALYRDTQFSAMWVAVEEIQAEKARVSKKISTTPVRATDTPVRRTGLLTPDSESPFNGRKSSLGRSRNTNATTPQSAEGTPSSINRRSLNLRRQPVTPSSKRRQSVMPVLTSDLTGVRPNTPMRSPLRSLSISRPTNTYRRSSLSPSTPKRPLSSHGRPLSSNEPPKEHSLTEKMAHYLNDNMI